MRFVSKNFLLKEYAAMLSPWLLVVGIFLFTYVVYFFLNENHKYGHNEYSNKEKNIHTDNLIQNFDKNGSIKELQEKYTDLDSKRLVESLRKTKCEYSKKIDPTVIIDCNDIDPKVLNSVKIPKEHIKGIQEEYKKVQMNIFSYFDDEDRSNLSRILSFYDRVADCVETDMCNKERTVSFFSGHIVSFVTWFCPYYEKVALYNNSPNKMDDNLVRFISSNKDFIPDSVPSRNSSYFRCKGNKKIEKELAMNK